MVMNKLDVARRWQKQANWYAFNMRVYMNAYARIRRKSHFNRYKQFAYLAARASKEARQAMGIET